MNQKRFGAAGKSYQASYDANRLIGDWWIDPISGSDSEIGTSQITALASWDELLRRVGFNAHFTIPVTVHMPRGLASGDIIAGNWTTTSTVRLVGAPVATLSTGTFTGVTASNNTSENWLYSDTAQNFALYAGERMRITSGARAGCVSTIAKAITTVQARGPAFVPAPDVDAVPIQPSGVPVTAAIGDSYSIETLAGVDTITLSVINLSRINFSTVSLFVQDILVRMPPTAQVCINLTLGNGNTTFFGCRLGDGSADIEFCGTFNFTACSIVGGGYHTITVRDGGGTTQVNDCSFIGYLAVSDHTPIVMDDSVIQIGNLSVSESSTCTLKRVGVYDSDFEGASLSGLNVASLAQARCLGALWGSGHTRYGVEVETGSQVVYSTKPTIAGDTNDVIVGGTALAYAAVPGSSVIASKLAMIQAI